MFYIYKEDETLFIYDESKKKLYSLEGEIFDELDISIEQLTRFRPFVEFVKKQTEIPKELVEYLKK